MLSNAIPDSHFASLSALETGYWWYMARVAWAKRLVGDWHGRQKSRPQVYADLGCGTGGFAKALSQSFRFTDVLLVDADPNALKRIHFPNATVIAAELDSRLSLPKTPSLISLMDVIEHVDDDYELVARAAALLAPGGMLLLSVPAHQILFSEWDAHLGHRRRYGREQLHQVVAMSGLKITCLRPMWSFLMPAGLLRKYKSQSKENLEFPPVGAWLNQTLLKLSDWEWRLPALPFGTSWILAAEKI